MILSLSLSLDACARLSETYIRLANWSGVCSGKRHHAGQAGREQAEEREFRHVDFLYLKCDFRDFGSGEYGLDLKSDWSEWCVYMSMCMW